MLGLGEKFSWSAISCPRDSADVLHQPLSRGRVRCSRHCRRRVHQGIGHDDGLGPMHWCAQPANIDDSIRSLACRLTQDVLSYAHQIAGVVENGHEAVPLIVVETDVPSGLQAVERPAGERREGAPHRRAPLLGTPYASSFQSGDAAPAAIAATTGHNCTMTTALLEVALLSDRVATRLGPSAPPRRGVKFRNANHSSVAANTSRIRYFYALGPYVVSLNVQFP